MSTVKTVNADGEGGGPNSSSAEPSWFGALRGDLVRVWDHLGWRFALLIGFGVVEAVLEGVGLLLFIPLVGVAGFSAPESAGNSMAGSGALKVLAWLTDGLELGGVLVVIALVFSLKGVVMFITYGYRNVMLQVHAFDLRRAFLKMVREADYQALVGKGPRLAHEMGPELNQAVIALRMYSFAVGFLLKVMMLAIAAFFLAPQIGVFFLGLAVVSTAIVRGVVRRVQRASKESSLRLADYSVRVAEAVRALKFLRATGRFEAMEEGVTKDAGASLAVGRRLGLTMALQRALQEPLMVVTMCGVLFVAHSVFSLELAILVASSLFLYRCVMELDRFQLAWQSYSQARGSLEVLDDRKLQLLEARRTGDGERQRELAEYDELFGKAPPGVEFQRVSYHYSATEGGSKGSDVSVLNDFSWSVEGGALVAVVGESGAGKTTLLDVLSGLLPLARGRVLVGGEALDLDNLAVLRSKLGYVTQTPFIFHGSVLENLALGNGQVAEEQLREAAVAAHCNGFIERLPNGYDTVLGEGGQPISGGQAQLLSIARELVRSPKLLLLDEPTSALDAESEDRIQRTLEELRGQVTLIIVSHRLATVRKSDRIVFLDAGKVVEEGGFEELRGRPNSRFRRFCDLQGVM